MSLALDALTRMPCAPPVERWRQRPRNACDSIRSRSLLEASFTIACVTQAYCHLVGLLFSWWISVYLRAVSGTMANRRLCNPSFSSFCLYEMGRQT